jgi:hypothetical protein
MEIDKIPVMKLPRKIQKKYEERYEHYKSISGLTDDLQGAADDDDNEIIKLLKKNIGQQWK